MHRVQVVDKSFHGLMGIFASLLISFLNDTGKVFLIYNNL